MIQILSVIVSLILIFYPDLWVVWSTIAKSAPKILSIENWVASNMEYRHLIVLMVIKQAVAGQQCTRVIEKKGETGEDPWFVWYFVIELSLKINLKHDFSPTWQSVSLGIKQHSFLSSDVKNWADARLWLWVDFIKTLSKRLWEVSAKYLGTLGMMLHPPLRT